MENQKETQEQVKKQLENLKNKPVSEKVKKSIQEKLDQVNNNTPINK